MLPPTSGVGAVGLLFLLLWTWNMIYPTCRAISMLTFFSVPKKDVLPEQQNFHLPPSGCVDSGKLCFPRHGRLVEIASMLCFPGKGITVFHAIPAAPASLSR